MSNLSRTTSYTSYINKPKAKVQGRIIAYKKSKYSKHTKGKTTHRILPTNVWQEKKNYSKKYSFVQFTKG
jgi:hypothetical protein